jgi:hypothetical protein
MRKKEAYAESRICLWIYSYRLMAFTFPFLWDHTDVSTTSYRTYQDHTDVSTTSYRTYQDHTDVSTTSYRTYQYVSYSCLLFVQHSTCRTKLLIYICDIFVACSAVHFRHYEYCEGCLIGKIWFNIMFLRWTLAPSPSEHTDAIYASTVTVRI